MILTHIRQPCYSKTNSCELWLSETCESYTNIISKRYYKTAKGNSTELK